VADSEGISDFNCGDLIGIAVARNCVYDALTATWLPSECGDDELTAEFNRSGLGVDGTWS
jgi:hypothetical protein